MTDRIPGNTFARIGETHGYRFDGDSVQLNAELIFSAEATQSGQQWALQLWAGASGFEPGLAGVKVAELAVYPVLGVLTVEAVVVAMPPAGAAGQQMALALVSWGGDGIAETRDLVVFPNPEYFVQPRMLGELACELAEASARLRLATIENPRPADNLSGTLALEVWALDAPYTGGAWQGTPVASLVLGVLAGGNAWTDCQFTVPAGLAGDACCLAVMLREWTPAGYVTRDFRNLVSAPIASLTLPATVTADAPAEAPKPAKLAGGKTAKRSAKAKPARPADEAAPVSVNAAAEGELAGIKGLSAATARAIVAARPYKSFDELSRVKGIGPKLLAKLRELLVL